MNNIERYSFDRDEFLTPFDSLFDRVFGSQIPSFSKEFGPDFFQKGSYPKVNVIDYKNHIEIVAEIPGLSKDNVTVNVQGNTLTISGTKTNSGKEEGLYILRELKHSSFKRSFSLGENIDTENIDAAFDNGILKVTLKKVVPSKPDVRKIEIK